MFVETCHACPWSKDGLNIYHCIYFYIGLYLLTQIIHMEKSISIQGVMGYILDTHTHSWSAAARQQDSLQHYIRYNYTRPGEDRQPIRFQLACQPKTNCVLALTEVFYLHNSNPKAKQPAPAHITDLFTSTKHTTLCTSTSLKQTHARPLHVYKAQFYTQINTKWHPHAAVWPPTCML